MKPNARLVKSDTVQRVANEEAEKSAVCDVRFNRTVCRSTVSKDFSTDYSSTCRSVTVRLSTKEAIDPTPAFFLPSPLCLSSATRLVSLPSPSHRKSRPNSSPVARSMIEKVSQIVLAVFVSSHPESVDHAPLFK